MDDPVAAYLHEDHPQEAELALWLRGLVRAADPDLSERVYRGWGGIGHRQPEAGYVCAIFPREGEVHLAFEHGASLPDPERRLAGAGRQVRQLPVPAPDAALADVVTEFVHAAITQRPLARRAPG